MIALAVSAAPGPGVLLWLVPPVVVTVLASLWVWWRHRAPRRSAADTDLEREQDLRRMRERLHRRPPGRSGP